MRNQHMWESTWRWMLNDCDVQPAIKTPTPCSIVADATTSKLLEQLAVFGAGASAEGLQAAYQLAAHVAEPKTAFPLDAMLALLSAQAKEMSSVRLIHHMLLKAVQDDRKAYGTYIPVTISTF